jgi:hypothetical protein
MGTWTPMVGKIRGEYNPLEEHETLTKAVNYKPDLTPALPLPPGGWPPFNNPSIFSTPARNAPSTLGNQIPSLNPPQTQPTANVPMNVGQLAQQGLLNLFNQPQNPQQQLQPLGFGGQIPSMQQPAPSAGVPANVGQLVQYALADLFNRVKPQGATMTGQGNAALQNYYRSYLRGY